MRRNLESFARLSLRMYLMGLGRLAWLLNTISIHIPGHNCATKVSASQGLKDFWYTSVPYAVTVNAA
jgi:hypothetical protein